MYWFWMIWIVVCSFVAGDLYAHQSYHFFWWLALASVPMWRG